MGGHSEASSTPSLPDVPAPISNVKEPAAFLERDHDIVDKVGDDRKALFNRKRDLTVLLVDDGQDFEGGLGIDTVGSRVSLLGGGQ